jgi:hypothetical protein
VGLSEEYGRQCLPLTVCNGGTADTRTTTRVRQPGNIVGAGAIAKQAELRELAMSLSKTANHPRNVGEVGQHNVK